MMMSKLGTKRKMCAASAGREANTNTKQTDNYFHSIWLSTEEQWDTNNDGGEREKEKIAMALFTGFLLMPLLLFFCKLKTIAYSILISYTHLYARNKQTETNTNQIVAVVEDDGDEEAKQNSNDVITSFVRFCSICFVLVCSFVVGSLVRSLPCRWCLSRRRRRRRRLREEESSVESVLSTWNNTH